MIRVRTLGQSWIHVDSVALGPDAEIVFAALVLLTVEPGKRITRGELLGILWPAATASRARHCLRQTIYRMRTLGVPLEVSRTHLRVRPEAVDCDVDALLRIRQADDLERVAETIGGPFLPGYAPSFSEPLHRWVEQQRDRVTAGARRVLVGAIAAHKARAEWADVERLAHRCLALDPLNEDATLALAEAAAMHGGKAEAMGILDRYLREMGPTARELRLPAITLRRRIAEPELEFPIAPPLHVPFVGRSAEMATLAAALRSARGGSGSVHFIHGEPGIGKTRLLTEFSRAALLEGARVAAALCQSSDVRRPLSAFVDLVPKLMTMPGALGCSPQSHKYLRRLIEYHSTDAPPTPDSAEAGILYSNIRRSLFDLFDAIASEVLLLITIEDAQWLDLASWEIVSEMALWSASRRIMVLLTSRESDETSHWAGLQSGMCRQRLGPMELEALQQIFQSTLRDTGHTARSTFRDWCVRMSGGNPYYLSELALHGRDKKGGFEVPPTLTTLVADRVARLRPLSCRVLQACAVLGKNATLDRIEAMFDEPQTRLLDAFDELEQSRLLALREGRLVCQHGLLLEAALERASRAVFAYLHRKAAITLSSSLQHDFQISFAWDCARHLVAAGERSQACALLMDCARHALELGRPLEADAILQASGDLAVNHDDRVAILSERAYALRAADQWDDVVDVLSDLIALEAGPGRRDHNDHELALISAKWAAGYDANSLLASLRECCRQKTSPPRHRLQAARFAFMLADNVCESDVAHCIYQLVAADLRATGESDFDRLYCRMLYQAAFGDLIDAEHAARELKLVLHDRSDAREICLARAHIAEVLKQAGDLNEGIALLEQTYSEGLNDSLLWIACLAGRRLAWHCLDRGEFDAAAAWVEAILPISERIQHVASRADVLGAAAEIALHRGETRDAAELLASCAAAWRDTQHIRSQAFWLASQTGVWLAQEDLQASLDALPRFLKLYSRVRHHTDQDQTTARLASLLEFAKQPELADRILREYLETHRRGRAPLSAELNAICARRCIPISVVTEHAQPPIRHLQPDALVS